MLTFSQHWKHVVLYISFTSMIPLEKSFKLNYLHLIGKVLFLSCSLNIFLLSVFGSSTMICLNIDCFGVMKCGFVSAFWICRFLSFAKYRMFQTWFECFSNPAHFFFPLSLRNSNDTKIRSDRSLNFYSLYSYSVFSDWVFLSFCLQVHYSSSWLDGTIYWVGMPW